jgi:aspartate-semialdehyde dehydrogenase
MSKAATQGVTVAIIGHAGNVGAMMLKALTTAPNVTVKVLHRAHSVSIFRVLEM